MKLHLDIWDVALGMEIKGLARERDPEEEWSPDWLNVDFSLEGRYINYSLEDSELMMLGEAKYLAQRLEALLGNEIEDDCSVGFAEPDLLFRLYPAKRLYSVPGKVAYRDGYMDRELYVELVVSFWCREGGLGGNAFTMRLYEAEIRALLVYLKVFLGEVPEDAEEVRRLVEAGVLV